MRSPVLFGKYLLLERISVGGMAEVFKAKTFGVEGFEKIVAIKRILPSMAEDEDFISMFIDEAKIAGQLSHANVCQIYELGKIGNSHFIAMEYVQGKDVLQIQNRFRRLRRPLPLPMAAFIASRVCEALDYAHRKRDDDDQPLNIVHRDVSPQNVLCSYEGEIKIIDFGIAKAVSRSSKTQAGVLKGKFGYMSPEQVRGLPLDRRSDTFAIGTLLWEMCTDERLFTGPSDFAVLEKVRNATVPPPSAHNPMIPPELEAIIMRALRRDPLERYQWATEMQEALQNYLLSQSPPWNTNTLSAALKEVFARELAREQVQLEHYKKISKEDLSHFSAPTPRPEAPVSLVRRASQATAKAPATPITQRPQLGSIPLGADDHEPTEVGGPPVLEMAETDGMHAVDSVDSDGGELDGAATLIYNDGSVVKDDLPAEPTFVFNTELSQMVHAAERPLLIESTGLHQGNGRAQPDEGHQEPTVIFSVDGTAEAEQPPEALRRAAGTETVPAVETSTLAKDVLIGILSAAVLILIGLVAYAHMISPRGVRSATLVVSTTSVGPARVLIDGLTEQTVVAGAPVTFRELAPGPHRVVVVPPAGDPIAREVSIAAGDLKMLSITFDEGEGPDGGGADAGAADAKTGDQLAADARVADAAPPTVSASPARATTSAQRAPTARKPTRAPRRIRRRTSVSSSATRPRVETRKSGEGYLVANTVPWAKVSIDGKSTGRTTPIAPASKLTLPVGRHKVTFDVNGQVFGFTVVIRKGQTTRLIERLPVQ